MIVQSPLELIFGNVFFELTDVLVRARVLVKLEGFNVGGSIKLKPAIEMIEALERTGRLRPGQRVIESSSGNFGLAVSIVCAVKGYEFICVTDPNILPQTRRLIEAYGARVAMVERRDANGGFLATRIALIHDWLARDPDLVWLNQYANQANAAAHERWTGPEIVRHVPAVDYVFIGVGTSGTLMGCSRYLRAHRPLVKIVAVDAVGSVTFGGDPGRRHLPGLGTSRRPELVDEAAADAIVRIHEEETVSVCRRLLKRHGLLVGASTGTVVAAVHRYGARIPPGSTVVAISPDFGDRYVETLYDDEWIDARFPGVAAALEPEAHAATDPSWR